MLPRLGSSDPLILASGMSHHTQPTLLLYGHIRIILGELLL